MEDRHENLDPRQDDEYPAYLRGERMFQAAQADARRLEVAQAWTPPEYPSSAYEQLAEEPAEVDWLFEGLWAGVAQVNAQKKSGKTTLLLNAAASLVTGDPFLGRFDVNVEPDCRVGYLNMELTKGQFNRWLDDMDLPDDALKRLHIYHGREYGRLDFTNDAAADWVIHWLRDTGISVLLMDPLGSFYDQPSGGDPNAAYLRWWARLEHLVLQAGLRGVLIAHHAGYSEDGGNRARGASAMMDKPDANMTYRYEIGEGNHTDSPISSRRWLSAFGRDVDVSEFEIEYNARTRRLYATGGGSRVNAVMVREAKRAWEAVLLAGQKGEKLGKKQLFDKLGWANTGTGAAKYQKWYQYAITQEWIDADTSGGKGKPIPHSPGQRTPHDDWKLNPKNQVAGDGDDE